MFFILPINTDCPIYHFPAATLGVIAANLLIHAGVVTVGESGLAGAHTVLERWCLWAGDGYHPEQWITSAFLHMDWLHVIGNCLFLWGFGLIVEGKLGWWRFLLLYLGIAAVGGAIQQTLLLKVHTGYPELHRGVVEDLEREQRDLLLAEGARPDEVDDALAEPEIRRLLGERATEKGFPPHFVTLGASTVIFGLLAVTLIWAPKNELDAFWIVWLGIYLRAGTKEFSNLAFGVLFLFLQCLTLAFAVLLHGAGRDAATVAGSELLHLLGAFVGAGFGFALLKLNWVDCENWDLLAVMKGTYGNPDEFADLRSAHASVRTPSAVAGGGEHRTRTPDDAPVRRRKKKAERSVVDRGPNAGGVRRQLARGDAIGAIGELEKVRATWPNWTPEEPVLFDLAEALDREKQTDDAAAVMVEYLGAYPEGHAAYDPVHANVVRMRAARLLLNTPGGAKKAARLLTAVDPRPLTPKQRTTLRKLHELADQRSS